MKERGFMQVAVDAVVFTIKDDSLQILLIQRKYDPFKGTFALPGGFVEDHESMEEAVRRELEEETGVKNVFLHQIGTYSAPDRDPRGRVISTAYLSLIRPKQRLQASTDAVDTRWFAIDDLPALGFDHDIIIKDALQELQFEIQTTNVAFQILPELFTLTQLQRLYEAVLGKELDKRNFRKKIKEMDILLETEKTWQEGAHRPAKLYKFKDKTYHPLQARMHVFLS